MLPSQKPFRGTQLNRTHPLAKGLVGCWLFNEMTGETVFDLSGNGNHGTLENGVAWGSNGLEFDGVNDYVDCGNEQEVRISGYNYSFGLWCYPLDVNDYEVLISKVDVSWASEGEYMIELGGEGNGIVRGYVHDGTTSSQLTKSGQTVNAWHHYFVVGSDSKIEFFVDGVSVGTGVARNIRGTTSTVRIGARFVSTAQHAKATIDDVRIYDRALSAKEVMWLYREPYTMFEPVSNPALLYSAAPPIGAIMNQFQRANIGADLYNGVFA